MADRYINNGAKGQYLVLPGGWCWLLGTTPYKQQKYQPGDSLHADNFASIASNKSLLMFN